MPKSSQAEYQVLWGLHHTCCFLCGLRRATPNAESGFVEFFSGHLLLVQEVPHRCCFVIREWYHNFSYWHDRLPALAACPTTQHASFLAAKCARDDCRIERIENGQEDLTCVVLM